jgi:hypothetical protein
MSNFKDTVLSAIRGNRYFKHITFYDKIESDTPIIPSTDNIDLNELSKVVDAIYISADEKIVSSADSKIFVPAPTN